MSTSSAPAFDQDDGRWHVRTAGGETYAAQFLLCATGCLSAVNRPDIPGIDDFAGEVYFTAAWPREDPDLRGKRVGLIGTGSSGIQAAPIIAAQAEQLVVFQRSANYTIPMPNRPWSTEEQRQIRQEYPERRRVSAYASAGTPHGTYPQKRGRRRTRKNALTPCGSAGARAVSFSPRRFPTRTATWRPTTSPGSSPKSGSAKS